MLLNSGISTYNLSDNQIGDAGAIVLSDALKNSQYIVSLDISNNGLTHQGAQSIFEALKKNTTLVELNISSKSGCQMRNLI